MPDEITEDQDILEWSVECSKCDAPLCKFVKYSDDSKVVSSEDDASEGVM